MERQRRTRFPQILRYPFFLVGLLILIGGGVGVVEANLPHSTTIEAGAVVAIIGFVFLILAVAFP